MNTHCASMPPRMVLTAGNDCLCAVYPFVNPAPAAIRIYTPIFLHTCNLSHARVSQPTVLATASHDQNPKWQMVLSLRRHLALTGSARSLTEQKHCTAHTTTRSLIFRVIMDILSASFTLEDAQRVAIAQGFVFEGSDEKTPLPRRAKLSGKGSCRGGSRR